MTSAKALDPQLESWIEVKPDCDFPIQNLPYGVVSRKGEAARIAVAIGESVLDLRALARGGLLASAAYESIELFSQPKLNAFLAAGSVAWTAVRRRIIELLRKECAELRDNADLRREAVLPRAEVELQLPFAVADYVDFYSSLEHATNMGKILRPGGEALMPNWRYLPIGYHGRASTIVLGGTSVVRPQGQTKPPGAQAPRFGPTAMLDIELEVGFVTGPGNDHGQPISTAAARKHIFGLVLVNDWSARDIQGWEYQPLGPFLGKSFATSISPWVVTLDALEPFRVEGPLQEPPPLQYLQVPGAWNYDINLEVSLESACMRKTGETPQVICRTNFNHMYWNMAQQLAHMSSNGTKVRPGDLYASGTISGSAPDSFGSLMELTWRGTKPMKLHSGEERRFLEDGDRITLRGWCERDGARRIGFGELSGEILPPLDAPFGPTQA
ncbi:MAG: fumarylacetoacetase [Candidatus Eremiobacteraeota bacterium]|nr:fumarylacetoacetase [Candidatus Eremiobacteraeota bacterium]